MIWTGGYHPISSAHQRLRSVSASIAPTVAKFEALPTLSSHYRNYYYFSTSYGKTRAEKSASDKKNRPTEPTQHIIHKAFLWKKMVDEGLVSSLSELTKKEGLTRARITQIMNLLKLPTEMQEFLAGLDDPKEIRKYSERKLRSIRP